MGTAGVSLTVAAHRATALVGLNGAGKSPLVKLLCRLYDPTRGATLWDGVDLRMMPVDELRRRIGVVLQDFMEYELSAHDNIAVGDLDAVGPDAVRQAGCHDRITALPHGYDSLLTRMFAHTVDDSPQAVLSGGRWQRLALARALMRRDPDLLILDEPNSGLDAQAEADMHEALRWRHYPAIRCRAEADVHEALRWRHYPAIRCRPGRFSTAYAVCTPPFPWAASCRWAMPTRQAATSSSWVSSPCTPCSGSPRVVTLPAR
ncbi:ATP-binding cassette domain-containing protein [Actinoplanes sp. NPDC023801]|uniref:ATP-binding cassette domain-containing protein n=1 Tax=Actinoplanes sp. NPDC023801 TaxID=3154595 RepID=UPI003406FE24